MRRYDFWTGVFWLLLSGAVAMEAVRLGLGSFRSPGPGFLFFLCAVLLGGFSLAVLLPAVVPRPRGPGDDGERLFGDVNWIKMISVPAALIVYGLLVERIGYLIGTFLLMGFLLRAIEKKKWPITVLVAVASTLLTYALFELWLHTRLPKGILRF